MPKLPLEGIRIIDMTVVWAGPWGSLILADLGAETIRTESLSYAFVGKRGTPLRPSPELLKGIHGVNYPNREGGERPFNRYGQFNWDSRNHLSMTVDLTRPEGKDIFLRLVKVSDGLIENQAARALERLGLTYDVLSKVNPGFIMVSMPMYGMTGPYKYRVGYGANMEAVCGHTWLRYYPGTDPSTVNNVYQGDSCGGATLAVAFMTGLLYRQRTGKGQFIDISQAEGFIHEIAPAFMDYAMNGRVQESLGNRDASMAPQGVYSCQGDDKWVVLSVQTDEEFAALCRVMGKPELADDPRFVDALSRKKNEDLLDPIISDWTKDKDQYRVFHLLQAQGVAAGPVLADPECLSDPHLNARGFFETVTHPEAGTHPYPGMLFKLPETPLSIRLPSPPLGQDNEYVYKELLGYTEAEYQHFIEEKHVGREYLPNAR